MIHQIITPILGILVLSSYGINRRQLLDRKDDMVSAGIYTIWFWLFVVGSIVTTAGFVLFILEDEVTDMCYVAIGVFFSGAISWSYVLPYGPWNIAKNATTEYIALTVTTLGMMMFAVGTTGATQIVMSVATLYFAFVENIIYIAYLYSELSGWYTLFGHIASIVVLILIQNQERTFDVELILRTSRWNMTEDLPVITEEVRGYGMLTINYFIYAYCIVHLLAMYTSSAILVSRDQYFTKQVMGYYGSNAIRYADYCISTPCMFVVVTALFTKYLEITSIVYILFGFSSLMVVGYFIDSDEVSTIEKYLSFTTVSTTFLIVIIVYCTYTVFIDEAPAIAQIFMWYNILSFCTFPVVTLYKLFGKHDNFKYEKYYVSLSGISKLPSAMISIGGVTAASAGSNVIVLTSIATIVSIVIGILFIIYSPPNNFPRR